MQAIYPLFFMSFLFSLTVGICKASLISVFVIALILNAVMYFMLKREDKKIWIIVSAVAFFVLSIRHEIVIQRRDFIVGNLYEFTVHKNGKSAEVMRVDGKYPKKRTYAKLSGGNLDPGFYKIYGKTSKFKDIGEMLYLNIEVVEVYKGAFERYREIFLKKIVDLTKNYPRDLQAFLKAILLGDKSSLDEETKDKFSYTGTAHLIVISGLHIGLIIVFCLYLFRGFRLPYQITYLFSFVFLTFYCLSIGFSPSTLRAYIMGSIYLFSRMFYEEPDIKKSLYFAFILSIFINPEALNSVSFQLSYMAVFAIVFVFPRIKKWIGFDNFRMKKQGRVLRWLTELVLISFSIQVSLTPIFLYYFRSLPVLSFLVNVIAVPLGTLVIQFSFCALIASFLHLGKFLMPMVYVGYRILIFFVDIASRIPLLSMEFYTKISPLFFACLYFCLLIVTFYGIKTKMNLLAMVLMSFVFLNINFSEKVESLSFNKNLYFRDSESVLILNQNLKKQDIWFLKDRGIEKIDILISVVDIDKKILEIFDVVQSLTLKKGESVKFKKYIFTNTNGEILKEEL